MGRKRVRKEVLVPGSLLPNPQPGRFHGIITAVNLCEETNAQTATVTLTDERKKIQIPWEEVQEYFLDKEEAGSANKKAKTGEGPPQPQGPKPVAPGKILPEEKRLDIAKQAEAVKASVKAKEKKDPRRSGYFLLQRIEALSCITSRKWPLGAKLWLKLRGYCPWPVVMWSMQLCCKKDIEQLILSYKPGTVLVRFYGEHSTMWVREFELEDFDIEDNPKFQMLKTWGRQHHKSDLVAAVLDEVENAIDDEDCEIDRLQEIERERSENCIADCSTCQEEGATVSCKECERAFHTLCIQPPALRLSDLPDDFWICSFCGATNGVDKTATDDEKSLAIERMGLTPDWIIQAAVFNVFQLERPTPERPYIKGLLDPCTNSMAAPNIPAEVLYDKQINGLKLSNSWAGYSILLNPPYTSASQWRFVNRAIDEVENDRVPAVLLLCRNSTDTAYFQRLTCYPRILIRRTNTRFKDYSATPNGFGVVMVAIGKSSARDFYSRFFDAFAAMGEPNIPLDKTMMLSEQFHQLLDRLRLHAEEHFRDHWIQCSLCGKWRIMSYAAMLENKDVDWTCRLLKPPFTSCKTLQTRKEIMGARYAVVGADKSMAIQLPPQLEAHLNQEAAEEDTLEELVIEEEEKAGSAPLNSVTPQVDSTRAGLPHLSRFLTLPTKNIGRLASRRTEVMSPIEMARQSRIAANRAFLAGLELPSSVMSSGEMKPLEKDDGLIIIAAKELAKQATYLDAKHQVEKARLQFAKVSQACKKEALQLQEAMRINEEELKASEENLQSAEAAYKLLEDQRGTEKDMPQVDDVLEVERLKVAEALTESLQAMRPEKDSLVPSTPVQKSFGGRSSEDCNLSEVEGNAQMGILSPR